MKSGKNESDGEGDGPEVPMKKSRAGRNDFLRKLVIAWFFLSHLLSHIENYLVLQSEDDMKSPSYF